MFLYFLANNYSCISRAAKLRILSSRIVISFVHSEKFYNDCKLNIALTIRVNYYKSSVFLCSIFFLLCAINFCFVLLLFLNISFLLLCIISFCYILPLFIICFHIFLYVINFCYVYNFLILKDAITFCLYCYKISEKKLF